MQLVLKVQSEETQLEVEIVVVAEVLHVVMSCGIHLLCSLYS